LSGVAPEPAPLPPADLASRTPHEVRLEVGEVVHRFYSAAYEPLYFDRGRDGRLNSADDSYGVLYAAREVRGAFAETFLREPARTLLPIDLLRRKAYVAFRVRRPLRLVKLAGSGLARVGATAEVVHGPKPYDTPRTWSSALHGLSQAYDGIAYYARHDDESLCYAIFERARDALEQAERDLNLDQDWFWEVAEEYRVGLAPDFR
jgi:hypothetical protein